MATSLTTAEPDRRLPADFSRADILIVGHDVDSADWYESLFHNEGIAVTTVTSSVDALYRVRSDSSLDLVVIDAVTVPPGAYELCRRIKQDEGFRLLPVIMLLGSDDVGVRRGALLCGADDCLTVPDQNEELLHRCTNLIRTKHATDVLENSEKVILALARMIEGKDKYTQGHVERVSAYSVQLGQRLGLLDADIAALSKGAIVHDVGKIAVPDALLNKPARLDAGEWETIKRHPVVGYDLLAPLRTFGPTLPIVRWHHERPNGTGYPDGIGGEELPLVARIAAVADCFDALTSARPYREALSLGPALEILTEGAARRDFDRDIVALMRELARHAIMPALTPAFV